MKKKTAETKNKNGHPFVAGLLVGFATVATAVILALLIWPELINAVKELKTVFLKT